MPTHTQIDDLDLPSIDDTIAAVSVLGRILEEMRARLAESERAVARLEKEKRTLRAELKAIVDLANPRPAAAQAPSGSREQRPLRDEELMAIMKRIDASFGQRAA